MKTAEEIIHNPPTIEAGAPFVCLDEAALNQVLRDALLHAAEMCVKLGAASRPYDIYNAILAEANKLKPGS